MGKTLFQRTLVIIKPDAIQRGLAGEIISRFEKKGLAIVGMKMMKLDEKILEDHYFHHKDKPFFRDLAGFMASCPVLCLALEGIEAVKSVRKIVGLTVGHDAEAGSIRGDYALSHQKNIVHASDSVESAKIELYRFFNEDELFDCDFVLSSQIYASDELV